MLLAGNILIHTLSKDNHSHLIKLCYNIINHYKPAQQVMMTPLFNDASWGGIMSTELIKEEKLNIGAVLAVSLSTVIAMLDSTIANVALPVIAKDFAVSESSSILIINAYQFAVIASLLVFAALGEKVGNKRIFIMGTILCFLIAGLCSLRR
ncbi:MFS transporter [Klebsiella variicola subsp. variicola]|nr:MFS transporter [Klebsiella variicola subsp. variicola]